MLIGLIFTDVIFRYIFTAPILGVEDTMQMGMVAVIFGSAPHVWRNAEHIVVDLFPEYRIEWLRIMREVTIRFLIFSLMLIFTWQAWISAEESEFFGNATNMVEIPFQPFYLMIAVSAAFHAIVVLIEAYQICIGQESLSLSLMILQVTKSDRSDLHWYRRYRTGTCTDESTSAGRLCDDGCRTGRTWHS